MSDLDLLRGLGDEIVPPSFEALRETARRRTRRTQTATVIGAAAALALVAGVTFLVATDDDSDPRPSGPPHAVDTTHPLTYALGATVHYGDQAPDAPGQVVELDVTDDGVVVRTEDGAIWFTDGDGFDRIGTLGEPGPANDTQDHPYATTSGFVVSSNVGSRVGWFEYPQPGEPELVVYDTQAHEETSRQKLDVAPGSFALLGSVTERYGYWYTDTEGAGDGYPLPQERIDLTTGTQESVTIQNYAEDGPGPWTPRTMMISHDGENEGSPLWVAHDAIGWQLDVRGGRVEPQGAQPLEARDGATRKLFTFAAPAGYPKAAPNWVSQWLDDDTVVIPVSRAGSFDAFECRFSTRACEVAAQLPAAAVMPELG